MRFRRSWFKAKSVNFDFSAKSSSTDYSESNKPTPKSLTCIGSEKSFGKKPKDEILYRFC